MNDTAKLESFDKQVYEVFKKLALCGWTTSNSLCDAIWPMPEGPHTKDDLDVQHRFWRWMANKFGRDFTYELRDLNEVISEGHKISPTEAIRYVDQVHESYLRLVEKGRVSPTWIEDTNPFQRVYYLGKQ